jgi:hypothetical protein
LSSVLRYIGVRGSPELVEFPIDAKWRLSNKSHVVCIGVDWQSNESPDRTCSTGSLHPLYNPMSEGGGGGSKTDIEDNSDGDDGSGSDSEGGSSEDYYARRYKLCVLDEGGLGRASPYLHSCLVEHPKGSLVSPVFHPSKSLIAWSCGLAHICVVDYQSRREEIIPLDSLRRNLVLSSGVYWLSSVQSKG